MVKATALVLLALLLAGVTRAEVVAGGIFYFNGAERQTRNVAAWNFTEWTSLGETAPLGPGYIYALADYQGVLVVGGRFNDAGVITANNIAQWDGNNWGRLGEGMEDQGDAIYASVYALSLYGGRLIAAGNFIMAGGTPINNIAAWDGSSWSSLANGISNPVHALTLYNGRLVAGGDFYTASGVVAVKVAQWDGVQWSSFGPGISNTSAIVYALTSFRNLLIAGGDFDSAGGIPASDIAQWDGVAWGQLGSGMAMIRGRPQVRALAVFNNLLIAAGRFTSAGGVEANCIAQWNGASWAPLGSGVNNQVYALLVDNGILYVGGAFTMAGGIATRDVAQWDGVSWKAIGFSENDPGTSAVYCFAVHSLSNAEDDVADE